MLPKPVGAIFLIQREGVKCTFIAVKNAEVGVFIALRSDVVFEALSLVKEFKD